MGRKAGGWGACTSSSPKTPRLGSPCSALKEWEHGHMCSELWGPSRPNKPSQWAYLGEGGVVGM